MSNREVRIIDANGHPSFGALLRHHLQARNRSANSLAIEIGVNSSYLSRICSGDREPPRRHVVDALVRGLRLMGLERSHLYAAAGYLPPRVEHWDAGLEAYADLIGDTTVSEEDRAEFSDLVVKLAQKWRGQRATANGHTTYLPERLGMLR